MENKKNVPVKSKNPFRILVVDDSAVIRGFISRWLEEDENITVVATASNGQMAINALKSSNAEVVVLDIEMPIMDGLTALPLLIKEVPDVKIVMASTLTRRNADISMRAMQMGAADYVPKPESNSEVNSNIDFRRELINKIRALGAAVRRGRGETLPEARGLDAKDSAAKPRVAVGELNKFQSVDGRKAAISLRSPSMAKPEILAVGASTGGPNAVCTFLTAAKHFLTVPVVVTQHMPPAFTATFAEHVARATGLPATEGHNGQVLEAGHIYVAPGDFHMTVHGSAAHATIALDQNPPENFCRPAVDPMFRSVAKLYGDKSLGVILTGMGRDGTEGGKVIVEAGGTILAQDEKSSVVWGMPGSAALAGICSAVLSLEELGPTASRFIMGGKL